MCIILTMDNDIYFPFSYDERVIYDQTNTSIEKNLEKKLGQYDSQYDQYNRTRDHNQPYSQYDQHNQLHGQQRDHNQLHGQQRNHDQPHSQVRETFAVGKKQSCNVKWSTERILLCIIFVLIVCCVMQYITQQELTNEMNNLIDALKYSAYQQQQQHNYHQQLQRHAQNPHSTPAPEPLPLPPLP